jgi:hypothetical protein
MQCPMWLIGWASVGGVTIAGLGVIVWLVTRWKASQP